MNDEGAVPKWLREQSAKLRFSGSTPLGASIMSNRKDREKSRRTKLDIISVIMMKQPILCRKKVAVAVLLWGVN